MSGQYDCKLDATYPYLPVDSKHKKQFHFGVMVLILSFLGFTAGVMVMK